jgi:hypothetical protein
MKTSAMTSAPVGKAWEEVSVSFDRFCLAAGIETLGVMMEADAEEACGARHSRSEERRGHRWGRTAGKIGFHAGKVAIERPRVRGLNGKELALESWERAVEEDWLGRWAMNLMVINVSTRKFRRAVRLPEGDVPAPAGSGVSKSATSRQFVTLSAARMQEWMSSDLSKLDLLVVQIDGIHMTGDLVLVAAIGIDGNGVKHPLVKARRRTPPWRRPSSTTWSHAGSIRRCHGCSSSTDRRRSRKRSGAASGARRSFNGAKFTRLATSWSGCRSRCTRRCAGCCGKPGSWTMLTRPRN